jgi:hypothetical protein
VLADDCRAQLCRLIPLFGVDRQRRAILDTFAALTGESLAIAPSERSPERSRINADGTPFQIALDLRDGTAPALQFLGEAGRQDASSADRRSASLSALRAMASVCGVDGEAVAVEPLLDTLIAAPRHAPVPASLFWFAVRFAPNRPPALTTYVNGAWGSDADSWRRCDRLAAAVDAADRWRQLRPIVAPLGPLGVALTLRAGVAPSARVYLRGYGRPVAWYREAITAASESAVAPDVFDTYAAAVLDGLTHPTQSAVFSADLGPAAGAKVEFCAHCAFDDDATAQQRIDAWLRGAALDVASYSSAVAAITGGQPVAPRGRRAALHAFTGVGVRGSGPYASIYLNPGAIVGRA